MADIFATAAADKLAAVPLRFTEKAELLLDREEALHFVKHAKGAVQWGFQLTAFLPTSEDRGFEGISFIHVSRKEALNKVAGLLSQTLSERGARMRFHITPPGDLSNKSPAYISIY